MNAVDIILLICFVPAVFVGLKKGLMVQACSLLGVVASIWCAAKFAGIVGGLISPHLDVSPLMINVISFVIILIIVSIIFSLLGKLLAKLMKFVLLGWLDKLLGIILAMLVTLAILGVVVVVFDSLDTHFHIIKSTILQDSTLYQGIKQIALAIFPYLKQLLTGANG